MKVSMAVVATITRTAGRIELGEVLDCVGSDAMSRRSAGNDYIIKRIRKKVPKLACACGRSSLAQESVCVASLRSTIWPSSPTNFYFSRLSNRIETVSPTSLPMIRLISAFIGSLCVPSPIAMNELRNGQPSTLPLTFTSPRVAKNLTDSGQTT